MVIIIILISHFTILSCNFLTKKNTSNRSDLKEIVTIYDYQLWWLSIDSIKKDLRDSSVYNLDTAFLYNRKNWVFTSNDSIFYDNKYVSLSYGYPYAIEKDSFFLGNTYCPNLYTTYLKYGDAMISLIVSHYNIENSCDEEMYVYWNHDYGLVALYNYPWGVLTLFDRETKKGFAKNIFYNDFINRTKEKMRLMRESFDPDEYQ